ncbi:hypothetical protein ACA910_007239 [Epithemia clementina (nom. ined.)]
MWIAGLVVLLQTLGQAESSAVAAPPLNNNYNKPQTTARVLSGPKLRRVLGDMPVDQMPSLFTSEEEVYDRYAACLAATEGLRRIRDRDLAEELQKSQQDDESTPTLDDFIAQQAKNRRKIAQTYIRNSGKVLRAMGMTVKQFNELGGEISQDTKLKGKVMEQAYLYRMAATINMDRSHFIDYDEDSDSMRGSPNDLLATFRRDKVRMFCESMNEIEKLRAGQVERLKKSLQVDRFPENVNISDRALLPFLAPRVRAVVEAFPLQAEAIVKKHGLQSDEFNQMLKATRTNPIFRWKIQKQLRIGDLHDENNQNSSSNSGNSNNHNNGSGNINPSHMSRGETGQPMGSTTSF